MRKIVRNMLGVRQFETISDALTRKKYDFLRKINCRTITTDQIGEKLRKLGLKRGDVVIMHSSLRALIGYTGSPKELIDCILDIIGNDGTLLMPAYTNNKEVFNYFDPTSAGSIAECFRKNYSVKRSLNNMFSMCAIGKDADYLTKFHLNSKYCFDENSPYYRSIHDNAKILLLGLGKNPHKISLFHCISYELRKQLECYKNVYTSKKNGTIIDKNKITHEIEYLDRQNCFQNNKKKFRNLFQRFISSDNYCRINKTDIYLFNAKDMYSSAKEYVIKNNYNIYK